MSPFAAAEAGRHDSVPGIAALPEHKPVVVLYGQNDHFHTRSFHRGAPLIGIEVLQGEDGRVFFAVAPFHARESIRAEVNKGDEFILQRSVLVGGGHYVRRFPDYVGRRITGFHRYRAAHGQRSLLRACPQQRACKQE